MVAEKPSTPASMAWLLAMLATKAAGSANRSSAAATEIGWRKA
jgi:hypothetical protein